MPIPLAALAAMGSTTSGLAGLLGTLGGAGAAAGGAAAAGGGLAAATAAGAGGLASGGLASTGIPTGMNTAGTAAAQNAMAGPSFLGRLGSGLKSVGQFGLGSQLGPMGLGQDVLSGLGQGQFPKWGDMNAMQRGAFLKMMMPQVNIQSGGRQFSMGGGGGGGLTQALLMSKFLNRQGGENDQNVNARAQTRTVRVLQEPFDVGGGVQPPRFA